MAGEGEGCFGFVREGEGGKRSKRWTTYGNSKGKVNSAHNLRRGFHWDLTGEEKELTALKWGKGTVDGRPFRT